MVAPGDNEMKAAPPSAVARGYQFTRADKRQLERWGLPGAILAATFLCYAVTMALGFVFDDHVLIVTNDSIKSWHYFPSYFASHIWSFRYPHLLANYYRPFFMTWLRLNDAVFGLQAWGWHLTSVLAHVVVTLLVYRVALQLTEDLGVAVTAALLFGLHPVHVEAVADITSIQEPLSTFFILAAFLAFLRSRAPRAGRGWTLTAMVLTAAALLSKESGMMVPVLIGVYAWIYGERGNGDAGPGGRKTPLRHRLLGAVRGSFPFWLVVLAYLPVRIWALKGFAHIVTPLPSSTLVFTIPSALLFYLRLMIWPVGLSCYYDTPYVAAPNGHYFIRPVLLLTGLTLGLACWYVRTRRTSSATARVLLFASLWTLLTILPVLNFRFLPEGEIAHDRYVYLPSVGFVLLAALAIRQLADKYLKQPRWALGMAIAFSVVAGYATARQCLFWSDDLTLNYRAHEIAPHNVYATTSLAAAVAGRGMDGPAMALYQQALAINPAFWRANVNLAYLYYQHGDYPRAARYFARAGAIDPTDGDQFLYLGMAHLRMGHFDEAEKAIRLALLVRPRGKNYHLGLAMVLKGEGKLADSKRELEAELSIDPQNKIAKGLLSEIAEEMAKEAKNPATVRSPERRPDNIK